MFSGTLDAAPLTELLGLVARTRKTGALHLWGPATGKVELLDGDVTFATARADDDLGSLLVRAGFLSPDDWQEAVASTDPARQVASVLRQGGVDPERLHSYVRLQTEEAIWELDRWWGEFSYEDQVADPLNGAFRHPVSSLLGAVRRRDAAWAELERVVPSTDLVVIQAPARATDDEDLTLTRAHYRLLAATDGQRSVADLARDLGSGLFRTCELLAPLLAGGLLVLQEPAPAPASDGFDIVLPQRELVGATIGGAGEAAVNGWTASGPEPSVGLNGTAGSVPGGAVEFVSHREQPARDLILRLLSAVKDLET